MRSLLTIVFYLITIFAAGQEKLPDFDFPKSVISKSETQLKKALAANDGVSTIDALIKYSLANSTLSAETFQGVISKIENVIKKEKKDDIKALLLYLESEIYRSNAYPEKADSLYLQAINNATELKAHNINEYKGIINCDALGSRICPTLYDFLLYKKNGYSHLYTILEDGEMQGFKLLNLDETAEENYAQFTEYINKYPNGIWTNDIKNKLAHIERQEVTVNYKEQVHSCDSILIDVISKNATNAEISLYAFPENVDDENNFRSYKIKDLKKVYTQKVTFDNPSKLFNDQKQINIGKLPKGTYHVEVSVNGNKTHQNAHIYNALRVKDTSYFTINEAHKDTILTIYVDTKTGEYAGKELKAKDYKVSSVKKINKVQILSDLAIYRPGETINYTLIACNTGVDERTPLAYHQFRVAFRNSEYEEIEADTLITDSFGQLSSSFNVPIGHRNGEFCIEAQDITSHNNNARTFKYITVSEYKTPSFLVDLSDNKTTYDKDKPVIIKGSCTTFSGMPIPNREVKLVITSKLWFWKIGRNNAIETYNLKTTTNERGEFSAIFQADSLDLAHRHFSISATVTDASGESQEGSWHFFIGQLSEIKFNGHRNILIDNPVHLPVQIISSDNNAQDIPIFYSLALADKPDRILQQGEIKSTDLVDLHKLSPGSYTFRAHTSGNDEGLEETIVLYHKNDKNCPVSSALWIPEDLAEVSANGVLNVKIGTAFHSHVYYLATSRTGVVKHGWLDYTPGINNFKLQIPDGSDQFVEVQFYSFYEGKLYHETVYKEHVQSQKTIKLNLISFRDKICPGTKETLKFSLSDQFGNPVGGRLALELISKAADKIRHNNWQYSSPLLTANQAYFWAHDIGQYNAYGSYIGQILKGRNYSLPELNLYDRYFYWGASNSYVLDRNVKFMRSAASPLSLSVNSAEEMLAKENDALDESSAEVDFNNIGLREEQVKVALWEPAINISENGSVSVEFDVPSDNTTWLLQAFAFTDNHVASNSVDQTIIAQRQLMVQPSLPRFLRSGDKTMLMANIQNSTDHSLPTSVIIELFNPRTNQVIKSQTTSVEIPANGTTTAGISCEVPLNQEFIGFRIKASANGSGDGEQQMIPVLPSAIPVVETIPFYLDPWQGDSAISIDKFPKTAQLTFEYCNNPVWYCVDALPTIYNTNATTATQLIHNLYAISLAKALASENNNVAEALKGKLDYNKTAEKKIITQLCNLQNEDGGISWFNFTERKSSEYVTYEVLERLGELRHLGCAIADSDLQSLEAKALIYYEKLQLKHLADKQKWAKESQTKVDYSSFADYLYLRTLYPLSEFVLPKENAKLLKNTLNNAERNWRNFSLATRAYVALSLSRNNRSKTARLIIESLRQHAINDPKRGMFWDNLQTFGFRWVSRTLLTTRMLEAFNEIDAHSQELDQIRKWLLLEKQTTHWQNPSMAAEAAYAILATGNDWLNSSNAEYLKQEVLSREPITIKHKTGSPAWGAVYATFPSEITSTKAFSLNEIEIKKELRIYNGEKTSEIKDEQNIKVGDKLQVVLTISTDRDMQYITIKDNRSACFEPTNQTSGYQFTNTNIRSRERIGYYQDIHDTETLVFIDFLPKGMHTITYDAFVTNSGLFATGLAEVTCMYAPQFTAHTEGTTILIEN